VSHSPALTFDVNIRCVVQYVVWDGGARTATDRMHYRTILQYFFKSISWRYFNCPR